MIENSVLWFHCFEFPCDLQTYTSHGGGSTAGAGIKSKLGWQDNET